MPEFTCPTCGQLVQGDECPRCRAATAIAKPEHAEQAKAMPSPAASDGAIREGEPPVGYRPAIRKETPIRWLPILIWGTLGLVVVGLGIALFDAARRKVHEATMRVQAINNMKVTGMTIQTYHDVNKRLPTPKVIRDDEGIKREMQLSWRVAIWPYIESSPLPAQFDWKNDWDHHHNFRFRKLHFGIFTCPHREPDPEGETRFQYFTGPDTLFPVNDPISLGDIQDGKSTTLLFGEAVEPVIWTRPADMAIRPDVPLPLPTDRFCAALADGTVRFFEREKISDTILRQLIHPNDQKPDEGWDN